MPPILAIVADDLTGAADTGAGFLHRAASIVVTWSRDGAWSLPDADVVSIDTDSRATDVEEARGLTAGAVAACREAGVRTLYKKIDSTLRGHIGVEVAAALDAWRPDGIAVVAPAFPATGRTITDGQLALHGSVLDVRPVRAAFDEAGLETMAVGLDAVRDDALEPVCRRAIEGRVRCLVCDAESDDDLRAIARAGLGFGPRVVWVGSGGLAHALAAEIMPGLTRGAKEPMPISGPVLTVVGSQSALARRQAADLAGRGSRHVAVAPDALASAAATDMGSRVHAALRRGDDVLVTIASDGTADRAADPALVAHLGAALSACADAAGAVVLTGGDTAMAVLRAWRVPGLRLVRELEDGVVLSSSLDGRAFAIVTKSGSFGEPDALSRVASHLRAPCAQPR